MPKVFFFVLLLLLLSLLLLLLFRFLSDSYFAQDQYSEIILRKVTIHSSPGKVRMSISPSKIIPEWYRFLLCAEHIYFTQIVRLLEHLEKSVTLIIKIKF